MADRSQRSACDIFGEKLAELAADWATSPLRRKPGVETVRRWGALLDDWVRSDIPLIVRKSSFARGSEHQHVPSGRVLTFADNTTAHWAMSLALKDVVPSIEGIRSMMDAGTIPTFFALKRAERATLRYGAVGFFGSTELNKIWKVCHIDPIGLRYQSDVLSMDLDILSSHMKSFLWPGNMFLVPIEYGGLGETREFCEAMRMELNA